MITVERLTKSYQRFTAVDDVSFTATPGRVTGFLGPNGAGKSTTMRVLVGLTSATSGSAELCGLKLEQWSQFGVTSLIWLVVPLAWGLRSLLRSEVT